MDEGKQPKSRNKHERTRYGLFGDLKVVGFACIIMPIMYYIVQRFWRALQWSPTSKWGLYSVDELSYRFRDAERGEVIIFRFPNSLRIVHKRTLVRRKQADKDNKVTVFNEENPKGCHERNISRPEQRTLEHDQKRNEMKTLFWVIIA